jgi:hypothetical protein
VKRRIYVPIGIFTLTVAGMALAARAYTRTGIVALPAEHGNTFAASCQPNDAGIISTYCTSFDAGIDTTKFKILNTYLSSTGADYAGSSEGCGRPENNWVEGGLLYQIPTYNPTDACGPGVDWSPHPNGDAATQYFEQDDSGRWKAVSTNPTNVAMAQGLDYMGGSGNCFVFEYRAQTGNIVNIDNNMIVYSKSLIQNLQLSLWANEWVLFEGPEAGPVPPNSEIDIQMGVTNLYSNENGSSHSGGTTYTVPSGCGINEGLCTLSAVICPGAVGGHLGSITVYVNGTYVGAGGTIVSQAVPSDPQVYNWGTPITPPGTNYPGITPQELQFVKEYDCPGDASTCPTSL